jgi:L-lysine exporter family protein LysE/ArgO
MPPPSTANKSGGHVVIWPFIEGMLLGMGLLIALGPKDVFVIRNTMHGRNALELIAICSLADVLLISLGVLGLGAALTSHQWLMTLTMVFSIAYLAYFGVKALLAIQGSADSAPFDKVSAPSAGTNRQVIKAALFHSLLTPYAWLDTVLVIGSLSALKSGPAKLGFAAGAMTASFTWFVFLVIGSRMAAPAFRHRRAWQLLDLIVAASMLTLATKLAADYPWRAA